MPTHISTNRWSIGVANAVSLIQIKRIEDVTVDVTDHHCRLRRTRKDSRKGSKVYMSCVTLRTRRPAGCARQTLHRPAVASQWRHGRREAVHGRPSADDNQGGPDGRFLRRGALASDDARPTLICVRRRASASICVRPCFLRCCRQTIAEGLARGCRSRPNSQIIVRWLFRIR